MMRKVIYEKTLKILAELVKDWGKAKVYSVGGCVRDSLLGVSIKDIDLMIDLENGPSIFCDWLKQEGKAINFTVFPRYGTAKFEIGVNGKYIPIECVMPRRETYNNGPRKPDSIEYASLKEDATRRDFCCNALYQDINTLEIFDPTEHGLEDVKAKILRTPLPAEQTFKDDPLRMLRAFRFWAEKDFKIHPDVFQYIKPYPEYERLSMERVREEMGRIIKTKRASEIIRSLHQTGLLKYIIPELDEAWGFNQNSHYHSMNLTDHTLSVLDNIKSEDERVRMAALLHDISKYKCWKVKDNGEFSYHGHDKKSAEMARNIMKRLKYSEDNIKVVEKLILEHMILKPFKDPMTGRYNGSPKITRKIIRNLGDELELCLDLIHADNISHSPAYNMPDQVPSFYYSLRTISKVSVVRSCPISGNLIMETFGLKPGPAIKEIKNIMLDWLDENPELTKEELLDKYSQEFEGHEFWIWKGNDMGLTMVTVTYSEPWMDSNGIISIKPYEIPYYIEENIPIKGWKEKKRAIEFPILYSALTRTKKARDIFNEAALVLTRLENIPGFKQVNMCLDSYNDLSGKIEWKDLKPDYIL